MQERTGAARSTRITVRLSREDQHKVEEAAKNAESLQSPSAVREPRAAIRERADPDGGNRPEPKNE